MLIRYPGGKQKLAHQIVSWLMDQSDKEQITQYREPFFGAGAIGFKLFEKYNKITSARINDKDPGIACLWYSVVHEFEGLNHKIDFYDQWLREQVDYHEETTLSSIARSSQSAVEEFRKWRDILKSCQAIPKDSDRLDLGAMKLACHQMSFSGLGTVTGPIGGWEQKSRYGIGCRYFPKSLKKNAKLAHHLLSKLDFGPTQKDVCTSSDFEQVFKEPGQCIFYVDPPYYEQGPSLYQCSFTNSDHKRLADLLRNEKRPWILSYDNHEEVKKLYDGFNTTLTPLNYFVSWKDRETEGITVEPKQRYELVISNRCLENLKPPLPKKIRPKPVLTIS